MGDRLRALFDKRLLIVALVIAVFLGSWLLLRPPRLPTRLRIGAGLPGGTWTQLGTGYARVLAARFPGMNVDRLSSGELDLAFIQNDGPSRESVRMIAPLYDNVLHLVVRLDAEPPIEEIGDLRGRRVGVGAPRSGTALASWQLLGHFGIGEDDVVESNRETREAIAEFEAGKLDAVFVFAALPGSPVRELLVSGRARLLSLGVPGSVGSVAEGFCMAHPAFRPAVIPRMTYGAEPAAAVSAISAKTVLACRADLDPYLVYEILRTLFARRLELEGDHVIATRLSESFDPSALRFTLHEGAATWFHRKDPPFFIRYADPLSFALSTSLALGSGFFGLRQWIRRRKKNRIDVYYVEVGQVANSVRGASREQLIALRERLEAIRRRAFDDLIGDRVGADETFNIFQSFLQSELRTIRNRLTDPQGSS